MSIIVAGCGALLGVETNGELVQADSEASTDATQTPGSSGGRSSSGTVDGCTPKQCGQVGVGCGEQLDGCGGSLRCDSCENCEPLPKEQVCANRCGTWNNGCNQDYDCGTECAQSDAGEIRVCFREECCDPIDECGDNCGVSLDRGCGVGTLECPGPGQGDTFVCFQGKKCYPPTCGTQCGVTLPNPCGGADIVCPEPSPPSVCHLGHVCTPSQCFGRCNLTLPAECGLGERYCTQIDCGANECCITSQPYDYCAPNPNPGTFCAIQ